MQRKEIIDLLKEKKFESITQVALKNTRGTFRLLIGITYDKSDVLCWRAIDVTGIIAGVVAQANPEVVRNLAQRLLWMMRDESGNNPSSAPEMLGEIVRHNPDAFADIAPVIASFRDELMLKAGVLRAIFRIGEVRPDLIDVSEEFILPFLQDEDPVVRAYALFVAGAYSVGETLPIVSSLRADADIVKLYCDGDFQAVCVGEVAQKTYDKLSEQEN
jgi:hypothetical protein